MRLHGGLPDLAWREDAPVNLGEGFDKRLSASLPDIKHRLLRIGKSGLADF